MHSSWRSRSHCLSPISTSLFVLRVYGIARLSPLLFAVFQTDPHAASDDAQDDAGNQNAELLDPVILTRLLRMLRGGREQTFARLLQIFHDLVHETLTLIAQAIEQGDNAAILGAAHKLRGSSRQMGARALAEVCIALEKTARRGEDCRTLLDQAWQAYARTLPELQRFARDYRDEPEQG